MCDLKLAIRELRSRVCDSGLAISCVRFRSRDFGCAFGFVTAAIRLSAEDWARVSLISSLCIRNTQKALTSQGWATRDMLLIKYNQNVGLVDDLIRRKTEAKQSIPNPDLPDREDARLYYVWNNSDHLTANENIQEDCLHGAGKEGRH